MTCNSNNPKSKSKDYICNPNTNRWVKKDGKIGKSLTKSTRRSVRKKPRKSTKTIKRRSVKRTKRKKLRIKRRRSVRKKLRRNSRKRRRRSVRKKLRRNSRKRRRRRSLRRKPRKSRKIKRRIQSISQTCSEIDSIISNENLIGEGGFGKVYALNSDKVVKIIYAKKGRIPARTLIKLNRETEISKRIEKAGIGPRIYDFGVCENKYYYIVMQRLSNITEEILCNTKNLNFLFDMYTKLSMLGIINRDPNIHNLMFDPKRNKVMFIDMGLAKETSDTNKALRENMITLFRISLSLSGIGRQKKILNCPNLDSIIKKLLKYANAYSPHLRNMMKTSSYNLNISEKLKRELLT